MEALKSAGKYTITEDMKERLADFAAGYATEEECAENIKKVYDKTGYVMDTHTSVASYVCGCYQKMCIRDSVMTVDVTIIRLE